MSLLADEPAWLAALAKSREARLARLASPSGWLSLVERIPLDRGANPTPLGTATFTDDGAVHLAITPGLRVTRAGDGAPLLAFTWPAGSAEGLLAEGPRRWELLRQADRAALRARDPAGPGRAAYLAGKTRLEFYEPDPAWRVVARIAPAPPDATLVLATGLGAAVPHRMPGTLHFEAGGTTLSLDPVIEDDAPGRLFVLFADATNHAETYEAGRFLYAPLPGPDGTLVLDFNDAFNPPCALTPYAACPLPPPHNRLPLAVTAGEKRFG